LAWASPSVAAAIAAAAAATNRMGFVLKSFAIVISSSLVC
jgi:hypothetical protein